MEKDNFLEPGSQKQTERPRKRSKMLSQARPNCQQMQSLVRPNNFTEWGGGSQVSVPCFFLPYRDFVSHFTPVNGESLAFKFQLCPKKSSI